MNDVTAYTLSLLQIAEVARRLSASTKSVRRWIAADQIALVRLGRSIRISEAELARFVASHASNTKINADK